MTTAVATKTFLHIGCGRKKWPLPELLRYVGLSMDTEGAEVIHSDADERLDPDMVLRLGGQPIRLPDNSVDVILAWHVLEHVGRQGETSLWFDAWQEMYRVLKPGGLLYGESPNFDGIWAWSDPTHTRAISRHSFVFFSQDSYRVPNSAISPYRIHADFQWAGMPGMPAGYAEIVDPQDDTNRLLRFALSAKKPFKGWWED